MTNTDKLVFFNKKGYPYNFRLNENNEWYGKIFFEPNSTGIFKTLGIYTLENVDSIEYATTMDIINNEIYNTSGMTITKETYNDKVVTDIKTANQNPNFYSKWIFGTDFQTYYPTGTVISFTGDFSTGSTDFNYQYFFVVLRTKRDAFMITTTTDNDTYSYVFNSLTDDLKVQSYNTISLLDTNKTLDASFNVDIDQKISIVGSQSNDGVYEILNTGYTFTKIFDYNLSSVFNETINVNLELLTERPLIYTGNLLLEYTGGILYMTFIDGRNSNVIVGTTFICEDVDGQHLINSNEYTIQSIITGDTIGEDLITFSGYTGLTSDARVEKINYIIVPKTYNLNLKDNILFTALGSNKLNNNLTNTIIDILTGTTGSTVNIVYLSSKVHTENNVNYRITKIYKSYEQTQVIVTSSIDNNTYDGFARCMSTTNILTYYQETSDGIISTLNNFITKYKNNLASYGIDVYQMNDTTLIFEGMYSGQNPYFNIILKLNTIEQQIVGDFSDLSGNTYSYQLLIKDEYTFVNERNNMSLDLDVPYSADITLDISDDAQDYGFELTVNGIQYYESFNDNSGTTSTTNTTINSFIETYGTVFSNNGLNLSSGFTFSLYGKNFEIDNFNNIGTLLQNSSTISSGDYPINGDAFPSSITEVEGVSQDINGRIYFSLYTGGIYIYDTTSNTGTLLTNTTTSTGGTHFIKNDPFPVGRTRTAIYNSSTKKLYVGGEQYIWEYNFNNNTGYLISGITYNCTDFYLDKVSNLLYVSTPSNIKVLNLTTYIITDFVVIGGDSYTGLTSDMRSVSFSRDRNILASAPNGYQPWIYNFKTNIGKYLSYTNTSPGGIYQVIGQACQNSVTQGCMDWYRSDSGTNVLVVGFYDSGLWFYDDTNNTGKRYTITSTSTSGLYEVIGDPMPSDYINNITVIDDIVYIGTQLGLWIYNPSTNVGLTLNSTTTGIDGINEVSLDAMVVDTANLTYTSFIALIDDNLYYPVNGQSQVWVYRSNESITNHLYVNGQEPNVNVWEMKAKVNRNSSYTLVETGNTFMMLTYNKIYCPSCNFINIGYSTGMIISIAGSRYPLNNAEYNIIGIDSHNIELSYQGAMQSDYTAPLSLKSREYLRRPRETNEKNIYYRYRWEDDVNKTMFFYDLSGDNLVPYGNNIDYAYTSVKPLVANNDLVILNTEPNKNKLYTTIPYRQQTVFNQLNFLLEKFDDDNITILPRPIETFIGYKSSVDSVDQRNLIIERVDNIVYSGYSNGVDLYFIINGNTIEVSGETISNINLLEMGFKSGRYLRMKFDDLKDYTQGIFEDYQDFLITNVTKKTIIVDSTLTTFNTSGEEYNFEFLLLPERIALFNLYAETEAEDERIEANLRLLGIDLTEEDEFIFKHSNVTEDGIDYRLLNRKRKEMLNIFPEIYNYIGSYKAILHTIDFFGYNDVQLTEYYRNLDVNSEYFNKLKRVVIPDIIDREIEGWSYSEDLAKRVGYVKTNLLNLTYRITDEDGNNVYLYTLKEVQTKLTGLKNWMRRNVIPVNSNIRDITGVSETQSTTWRRFVSDVRLQSHKVTQTNESINFNYKATHNFNDSWLVSTSFYTISGTTPDSFDLKIVTYKKDNTTGQLIPQERYDVLKTDMLDYNFEINWVDYEYDSFFYIETKVYNDYGLGKTINKMYKLKQGDVYYYDEFKNYTLVNNNFVYVIPSYVQDLTNVYIVDSSGNIYIIEKPITT